MNTKKILVGLLALALFAGCGSSGPTTMTLGTPDASHSGDSGAAVVHAPKAKAALHDGALLEGVHHIIVRNALHQIVDVRDVENAVTVAGKNYLLGAGLAGTPAADHDLVCRHAEREPQWLGRRDRQRTDYHVFISPDASFTSGDVGRNITIYSGLAGPATFEGTIISQTGSACVVSSNLTLNGTGLVWSIGPLLAPTTDTAASHAGWTAIGTAVITNSIWPAWTAGTVASGSVNNSGSPAVITMASSIATQYLHGLFLTSSSALATSSGTLYSEVAFTTGALSVGSSYTITDTYTLSLSKGYDKEPWMQLAGWFGLDPGNWFNQMSAPLS